MSSLRPALRIARRTVLRSPGRSLLIAILVALPVAAATYADVIARTWSSPERDAQRTVGSADGAVTVTRAERLDGDTARWLVHAPSGIRDERDPARVDVAALLPAHTRVASMPRFVNVTLTRGEGVARTNVLVADAREPLHRFALRLEEGRAPGRGEALVSRRLAERLDLLDGGKLRRDATVTVRGGPTVAVSGLALDPGCLSCELLAAPPGSTLAKAALAQGPREDYPNFYSGQVTVDPTYLVDLPPGTSLDGLGRALAARGVALTTREALAHPSPDDATSVSFDSVRTAALVALIVAFGLLEVVLLAGTAFAVGARRQVRELGLLAAAGGSPRDVRRVVLAQGLVLGALGAALGVAVGFGVAIGGRPLWERLADAELAGGWSFGSAEIAVAALVGLLSGVAAAVVPALGAGRMPPVDALAGRFRVAPRRNRRGVLVGAVLLLAGAACGLLGHNLMADDFARYVDALARVNRTGGHVEVPSAEGPVLLIIGGATLALVGLVLLAPALIGAIARAGSRLPLSPRLAVRDAERHRHRTGPATSAIVVVVTGSIVLAFTVAGVFRGEEVRFPPQLPSHTLQVVRGDSSTRVMLRAARLAAAELPDSAIYPIVVPLGPPPADSGRLPDDLAHDARKLHADQRPAGCSVLRRDCGDFLELGRIGSVAIGGDDATTRLVAGAGFDAAARDALASGKALVFASRMLDAAGNVHIAADSGLGRVVRLPGHIVSSDRAYSTLPSALISRRTARAYGWELATDSVFVTYAERATRDDVDAATIAAVDLGSGVFEGSEPAPADLVLLLIAGAAAFVTLVGVAISVALSAAEGRADLATLAAVGAPPSRRRALMASQALFVGGLGALLGVVLGTFIAYTARATTGSPDFVVPWVNLVLTAIGVPLLAAGVAALCTRSRLPLVRRVE